MTSLRGNEVLLPLSPVHSHSSLSKYEVEVASVFLNYWDTDQVVGCPFTESSFWFLILWGSFSFLPQANCLFLNISCRVLVTCLVRVTAVSPCSHSFCHTSFLVSFQFSQASCPKGLVFLDLLCQSEISPSSLEGWLITHLYYIEWDLLHVNSFDITSCQMVITRRAAPTRGWFLYHIRPTPLSLSALLWKLWCWAV